MTQQRAEYLDMARGAGILLVVAAHGSLLGRTAGPWIYEFYMPLFFIISGYLCGLFNQLADSSTCRKRVGKLAADYFISCSILFLLWFISTPLRKGDFQDVGRVLFSILFGRFYDPANPLLTDQCWSGQLWFLTSMCTATVLLCLLRTTDRHTPLWRAGITLILLFTAQLLRQTPVLLPWCIDTAPVTALLMWIASWLGDQKFFEQAKPHRYLWLLPICTAGYVLLHDIYDLHMRIYGRRSDLLGIVSFVLAGLSGSILFLILCKVLCRIRPIRRILSWYGTRSSAIFIWHALWTWGIDLVFCRLPSFSGRSIVRGGILICLVPLFCVATQLCAGNLRSFLTHRFRL